MRALILIPLVALAACSGENQGWNPNYRAEATPYGNYLRAREMALTGRTEAPPQVVPVALPVRAPTAAEIAGPSMVQIIESGTSVAPRQPRQVRLQGAPAIDPVPPGTPRVTTTTASTPTATVTPSMEGPVRTYRRAPPPGATPAPVTSRSIGTVRPLYPRSITVPGDCTEFATPQEAQQVFIRRGGPQRDPLGIDPDGDGNACGYRPGA